MELNADTIERMNAKELLQSISQVFSIPKNERIELLGLIRLRASELKITKAINTMVTEFAREEEKALTRIENVTFEYEKDGKVKPSINNFAAIMQHDKFYGKIRFNEMTQSAEIQQYDGTVLKWTDTEEAKSEAYIEQRYGIYNDRKHMQALRILFEQRAYHPIIDIVEDIKWDGTERCEHFLTEWAKCEDSEYTREVSRLIFAGGIWRLYQPGSKMDDVPVLIGKQGGGKTSLVRFLALNDDYYGEVKTVEGDKAIEQLSGKWICEIAELSAFTKAKEIESVKAFITRQRDSYRRPYDRNVTELPRRCVFIGTTNNPNFLTDFSGNRRFYPVQTNSNGYELFEHENECRDYIMQCWAEAKEKYKAHKMPNYADAKLMADYQQAQKDAMMDDWRIGVVQDYLAAQEVGECVCVRQIYHEALSANKNAPHDPNPKESREVGQMIAQTPGWEKVKDHRFLYYGVQKTWQKVW